MIEPLSGYKANNNGYTSDNIIELMLSYFIMPASMIPPNTNLATV